MHPDIEGMCLDKEKLTNWQKEAKSLYFVATVAFRYDQQGRMKENRSTKVEKT